MKLPRNEYISNALDFSPESRGGSSLYGQSDAFEREVQRLLEEARRDEARRAATSAPGLAEVFRAWLSATQVRVKQAIALGLTQCKVSRERRRMRRRSRCARVLRGLWWRIRDCLGRQAAQGNRR
jgi:hypothetical protein